MSTEVKNKIREIRRAQGHTLETLSQLMGVSQSSIEKVEKGEAAQAILFSQSG